MEEIPQEIENKSLDEEKPKSRANSSSNRPDTFLIKDNEGKAADIEIEVNTPEKVGEGLVSAHVEYKLSVKTNLEEFSKEFTIVRRYSDFVWLREQLAENHKGYLVPPLPEKAILNRFNLDFIEYRRKELQKFLARIIDHPVLSKSSQFHLFLTTSNGESLKSQVSGTKKEQTGLLSLFGSKIPSSLSNPIENLSNFAFTPQKEPDQWFDAKKNYINALETQLSALARATNDLIRRQKELSLGMKEFGSTSSFLASCEADHDSWTSQAFTGLAETGESLSTLDEKLVESETVNFEDVLKDYVRILSSIKEMLNARNEKLVLYQNASKQLESKKEKLDKTKPIPPKVEKGN